MVVLITALCSVAEGVCQSLSCTETDEVGRGGRGGSKEGGEKIIPMQDQQLYLLTCMRRTARIPVYPPS